MVVSGGSPVRVLLVEDDTGDVLLVTEALQTLNPAPHVDAVGDGLQALDFLHGRVPCTGTQLPDVIFLDLNMPRLDGRQLLALVKTDPQFKHIPVVVLTTSQAPSDINASYDRHANAYVTKPADLDHLTTTVHQIAAFFTRVAQLPPHQQRLAG